MNALQKLLHSIRLAGLGNALRAIRYARYRDKLDATYTRPPESQTPEERGSILSFQQITSGGIFKFQDGELLVRFLAPGLVFTGWDGARMEPSYAVVKLDWPEVPVVLEEIERGWLVQSQALKLKISAEGALSLLDPVGQLLRWETPPHRTNQGWSQQAALPPETCIYGLGERAGRLNLRPGKYRLWNVDVGGTYCPGEDPLYINMPVYVSLQEAGSTLVFYDNTFEGQISLGEQAEIHFKGGPARSYMVSGRPEQLLERFSELTGRAPLPPRWALGYQQSKWGYRTEAEMRRIYSLFQVHDLPLSALTLDGDHLRGYRSLTIDEQRYPSLKEFAGELAESDVHLIASTNPGVKIESGFDLYEAGLEAEFFCTIPSGEVMRSVVWPGWTAFIDFTDPQAREWWGEQYSRSLAHGIEGYWHDMNEPATFAAWGDRSFPKCTQHNLEGRHGDHREAHNIYGMLMNQSGYEGLRKLRPDKRPFILSRAGWVGMQRHAWCWTGDVETSWEALRQTIATVLGLCLSGMPYSGPDIGGFSGSPSSELYIRWFQLASFLPFFRTHCAFFLPNREPWEFGEEVLQIIRQQLKWRYRLLPYWYTLAWQTSQDGHPLVRPLWWHDPQDHQLWERADAFLVGEALLVAPILREGAQRRKLYLPRGIWYPWNSGRSQPGGIEVTLEAPLEDIPVLVRAGSLVPEAQADRLVLHCYRPPDGTTAKGQLFSDDGDGFGENRLDLFQIAPSDEYSYEFEWRWQGEFAFPYERLQLHLHGFEQHAVTRFKVADPSMDRLIEIFRS